MPGLDGSRSNPLLKSLAWNPNRSPNANHWQLTASDHRDHLGPADRKHAHDFFRLLQM
jgi:hypothetical protein